MGYVVHHAIIVTGLDLPALLPTDTANGMTAAHRWAKKHGLNPTPMVGAINAYKSFLVPPDGSKEGWGDSDQGDKRRDEFVEFLRSLAYGDGSSNVQWVEVQYAGDEPALNTRILRGYGLRRGAKKRAA